jgi:tetratricopeptide (TPR) repeat protein
MKINSWTVLLFAILSVFSTCTVKVSAEDVLHTTSTETRKFNDIIARCTLAIANNPKDVTAYIDRAQAYNCLRKGQPAFDDSNIAIMLAPGNARSYHERAVANGCLKHFRMEVEDASTAIRLDPQYAEAYADRAWGYGNMGKFENSINDCNEALTIAPRYAPGYRVLGVTYATMSQFKKAIDAHTKAINLDSETMVNCTFTSYYDRAWVYEKQGQFCKAIDDYNKIIRMDGQDATAHERRGANYVNLGQYQKSIEDFSRALTLDPKMSSAYVGRAFAHGKLGQHQSQIDDSNLAITISPHSASAYVTRGYGHVGLRQYTSALSDFGMAVFVFVDATSLAILLPSIILLGLLIAAARKKSILPRRIENYLLLHNRFWLVINGPLPNYYPTGKMQTLIAFQIMEFLISISWAGCVMTWCMSHALWKGQLNWSNMLGLNELSALVLYAVIAIVSTGPILWILKSFIQRKIVFAGNWKPVLGTGFLFRTFAFAVPVLWLLPLIGLFVYSYTSTEYELLQDLLKINAAFSIIPLSLAGLAVAALTVHVVVGPRAQKIAKDYKLLASSTFGITALETLADERLNDLVDLALTVGDLEKGDFLSKLLMRRAEA